MKNYFSILALLLLVVAGVAVYNKTAVPQIIATKSAEIDSSYWLLLHRKSNVEFLYFGVPGDRAHSEVIKQFKVKVGITGKFPTPLPQLMGKDYWILTDKLEAFDNPDTSPYFLTLDVPTTGEYPFGPEPYLECNGQCDWKTIGYFGLHGINNNMDKLSDNDPGSSGCVRHEDSDIAYLYNLLNPKTSQIRYYIKDI